MKTLKDLFPDKWLTPEHLQGKQVTATISAVNIEELWQEQTKQKQPKLVLSFKGKSLRLPLNKTQAKAVAKITSSETFADWVGASIQLAPAIARNRKPTIAITNPPKPKATQPKLTNQPEQPEPALADDNPFNN